MAEESDFDLMEDLVSIEREGTFVPNEKLVAQEA
jgi:hypothetical protein